MFVTFSLYVLAVVESWSGVHTQSSKRSPATFLSSTVSSTWFSTNNDDAIVGSPEKVKAQILQLGAALDRGQSYNPTSGSYYEESMNTARRKIEELLEVSDDKIPSTLSEMDGEWELIFSTVPHGIFRSSPFFLAIQESYEYAEEKGAFFSLRNDDGHEHSKRVQQFF